jgi:hypothetical protein
MDAEYTQEYERLSEQYANADSPQQAEKIRAISELNALEYTLDLSDGDPNTAQLGGRHGDVKGEIKGNESHHLVPKSAVGDKMDHLTAVSLTKADHANTPSYGGRMGAKSGEGMFADSPVDSRTLKEKISDQIDSGNYPDAFRNGVYEVKNLSGDKMDGALKQAISAERSYLEQYGVP